MTTANRPTLAELLSPEPTEEERQYEGGRPGFELLGLHDFAAIHRAKCARLTLHLAAEEMCPACKQGRELLVRVGEYLHPEIIVNALRKDGVMCRASALRKILAANKGTSHE